DLHAQLVPIYFREPSANIGVGAARGLPPHLVGEKLLAAYKVARGSYDAYALAFTDFESLARSFGRLGGLDRLAALIKAIGPNAKARCCCSTAATPGRAAI